MDRGATSPLLDSAPTFEPGSFEEQLAESHSLPCQRRSSGRQGAPKTSAVGVIDSLFVFFYLLFLSTSPTPHIPVRTQSLWTLVQDVHSIYLTHLF